MGDEEQVHQEKIEGSNDELIVELRRLRTENTSLKQSVALQRAVIEGIDDAVYAKDEQSRYLLVNSATAHAVGYPAADMLGKHLADLSPAETARTTTEDDRAVMANGTVRSYEEVLTFRGNTRTVMTTKTPYRDECGRVVGIVGISRNITQRKRDEEALQSRERLFRAVFEGALDAMVLVDDEGYYVDANPAACDLFGLPLDQLLGKRWEDFAERDFDVAKARAEYRSAGGGHGSFRLVRPDGTKRETEYAARAHILPGRHLSVLRDFTARKQAEEASRRYAERLAILHEIDRVILAAGSPERSAQAALERLGRIVPSRGGTIMMFDPRTRMAFLFAAIGFAEEWLPLGIPLAPREIGADDLASLLQNREFVVADLRTGAVKRRTIDGLPADDIRSYARVPLTTEGQLLGSLNLYSYSPSAFDREHIEVAREVGDSLAIAIRQAQLFEEIRRSREWLTDLSRRLIRAEESERRRIALELHDEIGQALTALKLNLKAMSRRPELVVTPIRLEESVALVEQTIAQVRDLSLALRPALLDDLGLIPALRSYVGDLMRTLSIDASFIAGEDLGRQDPEIETACYRIAQEALTNVARHSKANTVRVELATTEADFRLVITDNGIGFDVAKAMARATEGASLGILGMRERACLLGGDFQIASEPDRGTQVRAIFRLRPARSAECDGES